MGTGAEKYDAQDALNTLERIPLDMTYWIVHNSRRLDLSLSRLPNEIGHRQSLKVIPPDQRWISKRNGNPSALDCNSSGKKEDDGTFFLLPYYLGRHYMLVWP